MWRMVFVVGLAAGCVKPTEQLTCGEFTCGVGAICSPDGTQCVAPETVYACDGHADGDRCVYTGVSNGVCQNSICIPGGCGNGIVEASLGEICDDGNLITGDGCRGDCKSTEVCGDGIQDLAVGELCDCGDGSMTIAGCNGGNANTLGATCRMDCTPARCGDGHPDPGESCDDGNNIPGDGCAADCSGRWTRMQSGTVATLRDVDARSPTDAWAVGDKRILHYDGQAWTPVALPAGASNTYFGSVYMADSGDVFVVEFNTIMGTSSHVYRYHAGAWATLTYDTGNIKWNAVGGSGSVVYLVGIYNTTSSRAAKYDAGTQTFINDNIAGGSAGELWKVAVAPDSSPYATDKNITPNVYAPSVVAGGWTPYSGLVGSLINTPTNSQMFLFDGTGGHIWNGSTSVAIASSSELTVLNDSDAIPNLALVVGGRGSAMFCTASSCSISATGTLSDLFGAKVLDDKHAFIVGADGTILY